MASVYIGYAQDGSDSDTTVTTMSAALNDIRRAADRVSQMIATTGLPERLARHVEDAKAASLRNIAQIRAHRDRLFGDELFFDPAWNILLDLYQRELEGRRVMVGDACNASGVPPTTGLRWLRILEQRGHVVRTQDPTDKRRVFVALTKQASERMSEVADKIVNKFYEI